jgi:hypothetical protein
MPDAPGELEPEGGASYTPGTPGGLEPEGGGAATPGDPGNLTPNTPASPGAPPSITPDTPAPPSNPELYARQDASNVSSYASQWRTAIGAAGLPDLQAIDIANRLATYQGILSAAGGSNLYDTDASDRIMELATGLKDIIGSVVDFWAFPSACNVGTGNSAYSFFGKRATFGGTTAPVWVDEGIYTDPTAGTSYVQLPESAKLSNYSVRSVLVYGDVDATASAANVYFCSAGFNQSFGGSGAGVIVEHSGPGTSTVGSSGNFLYGSPMTTTPALRYVGLAFDLATKRMEVMTGTTNDTNKTEIGTLPAAMSDSFAPRLGGYNAGSVNDRGLKGTFFFHLDYPNVFLTSTQRAAIKNLVDSTLLA